PSSPTTVPSAASLPLHRILTVLSPGRATIERNADVTLLSVLSIGRCACAGPAPLSAARMTADQNSRLFNTYLMGVRLWWVVKCVRLLGCEVVRWFGCWGGRWRRVGGRLQPPNNPTTEQASSFGPLAEFDLELHLLVATFDDDRDLVAGLLLGHE